MITVKRSIVWIVGLTALLLLASAARAFTYQIDDGTTEFSRGVFQGGAIAWLNSFQIQAGAQTLTSIDIVLKPFGPATEIQPVTVHLWTDPNNDGNPADAKVVRSIVSSTTPVGAFVNIPIVPLTLSASSWFYAGGLYARGIDAFDAGPVAVDTSNPDFDNRSYLAVWENSALADPNNLPAGTSFFGAEPSNSSTPAPGANYLVRVNAVPEPSILLFAVLPLSLFFMGRIGAKHRSAA